MKAKSGFGAVLLAVMVLVAGCGSEPSARQTMTVMDTVATLSATGRESEAAVSESMKRLKELEAMASPNIEGSDVCKLSAAAGTGAWVPLHPEIYHMLEVSQQYSQLTGGAWDVTMGPLVNLWGIGTDKAHVPSAEEITAAKSLTGWQKVELQPETHSARLMQAGMSLDFGGIAKGMALDEVRKIYLKHGIKDGLINLGASSIYALGKNDKGKDWRIGIRHPRSEDKDAVLAVVPISDQALSTSGDYERFFEQDGRRYHHILDPQTGAPAWTGVMGDTIVIDGSVEDAGMLSDLLTTAVFVLGPEKGQQFMEQLPAGITGMIVDQQQHLHPVRGFEDQLTERNEEFPVE
ncbi:MAG: FAD:protein FMN transferase [Selenomonas sp.]|nr:FAD:protein FMN transferase [Selenomonas sp.]